MPTLYPWLYNIFELEKIDKGEAAYQLMVKLDDMMHDGDFDTIDRILNDIHVYEISVTMMIGFLTCSRWCEDKLIHREMFVKRCRAELIDRGREDVKELMAGLE